MKQEKEIWKPCPGYEKWYDISNYGNLRSYHLIGGGIDRNKVQRFLTPQLNVYVYYVMSKGIGVFKTKAAHILVAKAFVPNPKRRKYVHHKDNDKHNPCSWNLEWVTLGENQKYAYADGMRKKPNGIKNGRCKLTINEVMKIFNSTENVYKLCSMYSISKRVVGDIKSGKLWSSVTGKTYIRKEKKFVDLSAKDVLAIAKSNLTQNELASIYNTSQSRVSAIKTGRTHSDITNIVFNGNKNYSYFGISS